MPSLLGFDGLNIVRRCYEANPAPDSTEKATAALRVAKGVLRRNLAKYRPDFAVFVMDAAGPNWRHDLYPAYKAQRKPMPAPLAEALRGLPGWKAWLEPEGLAGWEAPGYEADDLLASLANTWESKAPGGAVTLLSTDKDLCCLASARVRVADPFTEVNREAQWVQSKFGVTPSQLPDYLALTGDASDGIPGIAGIGARTAAALLQAYGTLEQVLSEAPGLPGAKGQAVQAGADMARLSRQLVALKTDLVFSGLEQAQAPRV